MKQIILLLCFLTLGSTISGQILKDLVDKAKETVIGGDLSKDEIGNGLKEALNVGVKEAVDFLSKENGYYQSAYKILLPEEAQEIANKLRVVPGFNDFEQNLVEKLNRAAEDAAKKATPIFVSAIKGMTFKDAMNILKGSDDAATLYLKDQTYNQLYDEFLPVIQASLDKVNAREYWKSAITAYNKIPFVKKTNPELDDYVNTKALGGLFSLVEEKEKGIRNDVGQRSSELLKRVFAQQD